MYSSKYFQWTNATQLSLWETLLMSWLWLYGLDSSTVSIPEEEVWLQSTWRGDWRLGYESREQGETLIPLGVLICPYYWFYYWSLLMINMFSCSTWWLLAGTFPAAYGVATSWLWVLNGLKPSLKYLKRLFDIWLAGKNKQNKNNWRIFYERVFQLLSGFIFMYFRFGKVEDQKDALRLYTVQIPHKRDRKPPPCYLTKWDGKSFLPMLTAACGAEVISSLAVRWLVHYVRC